MFRSDPEHHPKTDLKLGSVTFKALRRRGSKTHRQSDPVHKLVRKASYRSAAGQAEAAATSLAVVFSPDLDSFNILDVFPDNSKQGKTSEFLCFILSFVLLVSDGDILDLRRCEFTQHLSFTWSGRCVFCACCQ